MFPIGPDMQTEGTGGDEVRRRIFIERSQETKWSMKLSGRRKKNHKVYASLAGKERGIHITSRYTGAMSVSQRKAKIYDMPHSRLSV